MTGPTRARFVLDAAAAAGIRFSVDHDREYLTLIPPRFMPRQSWRSFEDAIIAHRDEIIEIIVREAGR
jgi:hypothetical protein